MTNPFLIVYITILLVSLISSVFVTYRDYQALEGREPGLFAWQVVLVSFDVAQDMLLLCSIVVVILQIYKLASPGWLELIVSLALEGIVCTNVRSPHYSVPY